MRELLYFIQSGERGRPGLPVAQWESDGSQLLLGHQSRTPLFSYPNNQPRGDQCTGCDGALRADAIKR